MCLCYMPAENGEALALHGAATREREVCVPLCRATQEIDIDLPKGGVRSSARAFRPCPKERHAFVIPGQPIEAFHRRCEAVLHGEFQRCAALCSARNKDHVHGTTLSVHRRPLRQYPPIDRKTSVRLNFHCRANVLQKIARRHTVRNSTEIGVVFN